MNSVNWYLVAVAFALGLVLTGAFVIGRAKREVPVHATGGAEAAPTGRIAAGAAGGAVAAGLLGGAGKADADVDAPYGAGSVRLTAGAEPPSGWDIKGNEDSMLYHTVDSPSYQQTIAELWFQDEDTARGAGFRRWNESRSASGATGIVAFADTEPEVEDLPPGPHGPGTAAPNADGSGPTGWDVKGNEDSTLYHTLESPYYGRTVAEVWFRDVESAEAAGFHRWDSGKSQRGKK